MWKKANPSLGITVGIDKVKAACESAQQNPGEENAFRQLRLNQWVKQSVRWMPMDKWDACAFPVSEDDLGRICYGGLDLSSTTDITAFVLVFRRWMRRINTMSCHTSGYRRKHLTFVSAGIMFPTTCGSARAC